ncbi:histidine triad nucleotide-binding protein [Veillonella montpellierensis]|uniref:histidine triad nucleotide-binding protein n=1 Tax=Veillonella montpellierensis TaxID=187328 RepID=UPI0023F94722|nr:histidine triad nucleotide-binding protein [Veillonella montpellierensis]
MLHSKEDCIFCKIINGEIPTKKVLENDKFLSFYDLNPVAKVHVLIVPKNHISNIAHLNENNADYIAGILSFAKEVAKKLGISKDGYRLIFNTGEKAGQTVFHMHAHMLGGEELSWPNP